MEPKMEQPKQYTPEEIAELEKLRTISDAELLKEGAEYEVGNNGNKRIVLEKEQLKDIHSEFESFEKLQQKYSKIIDKINGCKDHEGRVSGLLGKAKKQSQEYFSKYHEYASPGLIPQYIVYIDEVDGLIHEFNSNLRLAELEVRPKMEDNPNAKQGEYFLFGSGLNRDDRPKVGSEEYVPVGKIELKYVVDIYPSRW